MQYRPQCSKSNAFFPPLWHLCLLTVFALQTRYVELMRMLLQWRHLKMCKRGGRGHDPTGAAGTRPRELAIMCPSCPHPSINLPPDWEDAAPSTRYDGHCSPLCLYITYAPIFSRILYTLIVCLDANFRLKNQMRSSYKVDPGLGTGWAYFVPLEPYFKYVLSCTNDDDAS